MMPDVIVHVGKARGLQLIAKQAHQHLLHAPRLRAPPMHLLVVLADLGFWVVFVWCALSHLVEPRAPFSIHLLSWGRRHHTEGLPCAAIEISVHLLGHFAL